RLEIAGSTYSIFPVVHVSKNKKLVKVFPDRPVTRLNGSEGDRVDFDESLLPEDSWIQGRDPDEYEVERISDMRTGKRTRYGRIYREFLVHWRGYEDPTWIDEADLNCGAFREQGIHTGELVISVVESRWICKEVADWRTEVM
ncbi:hypothetical protein PHMEG_00041403, partial [Phytophthora megakarya]